MSLRRKARGETLWKIHRYRTQEDNVKKSETVNHGDNREGSIGRDDVMEQLKKAYKKHGNDFSSGQFAKDDQFCAASTVVNYFGSWSNAVKEMKEELNE